MIIPTSEIRAVQRYIFEHGCIVVEDKSTLENHPMVPVTNHKVMKIVKSMNSMGLFDREFIWKHAYYRLNNTGIEWLREKLLLEKDEYPKTHIAMSMGESAKEVEVGGEEPNFRQ